MSSRAAALLAALALAGCATMPGTEPPARAAEALAAAESAFAAQSVREGMRAAFLAWLAPDAILFRGGPVNGPEVIAARPDPPIVLDWRPVFVEVAASGELGLSTGPWTITSRADPGAARRHGQFVSVWKRVGPGTWRVLVDLGISHPGPSLAEAPLVARVAPAVPGRQGGLDEAEGEFAQLAYAEGEVAAYERWGAADLRLYREGESPYLGRTAARAAPAAGPKPTVWMLQRHETSAAGDFGFAMGSYAPKGEATAGHFVRVWRREAAGWRIVLDVVNALPR